MATSNWRLHSRRKKISCNPLAISTGIGLELGLGRGQERVHNRQHQRPGTQQGPDGRNSGHGIGFTGWNQGVGHGVEMAGQTRQGHAVKDVNRCQNSGP